MGPSPVKTFTINNNRLTNVFSRTTSKGYHHIKNTHILRLKHKFITSRVNFNKNKERSHQKEMNNQATGESESNDRHQSMHSTRHQEQHAEISSRSDHKLLSVPISKCVL
jgi:hypothetical protein